MRFVDIPDLTALGFRDVTVVYTGELWPRTASKTEPDLRFISETTIPRIRRRPADLVILDVEHWDLSDVGEATLERNIDRYVSMLETFRHELPNVRLGLYGMLPIRSYWIPVGGDPAKLRDWRLSNQRLRRLGDAVDVIFPSLYAFYDDIDGWLTYASANIAEARCYQKPVFAFIWPQYHKSRELIGGAFWRLQLETIFKHADGMVVWSPAKGKQRWNPDAPWWLQTVDFLESVGLAKPARAKEQQPG
jgi:hypothetical protein